MPTFLNKYNLINLFGLFLLYCLVYIKQDYPKVNQVKYNLIQFVLKYIFNKKKEQSVTYCVICLGISQSEVCFLIPPSFSLKVSNGKRRNKHVSHFEFSPPISL